MCPSARKPSAELIAEARCRQRLALYLLPPRSRGPASTIHDHGSLNRCSVALARRLNYRA